MYDWLTSAIINECDCARKLLTSSFSIAPAAFYTPNTDICMRSAYTDTDATQWCSPHTDSTLCWSSSFFDRSDFIAYFIIMYTRTHSSRFINHSQTHADLTRSWIRTIVVHGGGSMLCFCSLYVCVMGSLHRREWHHSCVFVVCGFSFQHEFVIVYWIKKLLISISGEAQEMVLCTWK